MTTPVQVIPSLPKDNYNIINPPSQLFKPFPIRKSENNISFLPTKTNSPNNMIYPNFGFGSYSSFNFNSLGNLQNYLLSQEKKVKVDMKNKPCCNCIKTKCMKKYCECFANNKLCTNCLCLDCRNKDIFINSFGIINEEKNKSKEIIVCTCSKSGCNKKYCECYKEGLKCNIKCRCINCLNMSEEIKNSNEKIINLDESKSESGKNTTETKTDSDGFNIQRISILINKSQTLINVEKLDKDEFNLLCKKRNKCLN